MRGTSRSPLPVGRSGVPARMSFEECARSADLAQRRTARLLREERSRPARRETFKAAEVSRLTADWVATIMHPDDEMRWSLRRLRARCGELSRNDPYARHFLNMLAVNVVGPVGPKHQAQVRDNSGDLNRRINDKIEDGWAEWCEECTVDGRLSFAAYTRQTLKGTARDGEGITRLWRGFEKNRFGFALEAIDPDQLDERYNIPRGRDGDEEREVRMGVEVDAFGRPTGYHVWNRPEKIIGMDWMPRERERLPADQIIHLYDQERPNQTRGLPWFLAVAMNLKMLGGYSEAELVAARTAAAKQGWFVKKGDAPTIGEGATPDAENRIAIEANPGLMDFAPDGYTFEAWTPEHPTTAFSAYVKAKLREIATGLSVSYNALNSDLEGVNYSSMRSGMSLEREMWKTIQQWVVGRAFVRRVYVEWLNMALLSGALVLDSRTVSKFSAVKFTPRGWQPVDPEKEMKSNVDAIQTGLDCRTDILAEQGKDYEEVLEKLAEEEKLAADYDVDVSGPKPTASSLFAGAGGKKTEDEGAGTVEGGETRNGNGDGHPRRSRVAALLEKRGTRRR